MIQELLEYLEKYCPNEYEILEKFYSESQNK